MSDRKVRDILCLVVEKRDDAADSSGEEHAGRARVEILKGL